VGGRGQFIPPDGRANHVTRNDIIIAYHTIIVATRPKRIGFHHVYRQSNPHGEWSIRIEPEGFQIDNYHDAAGPHAHLPRAYESPVSLPRLLYERARLIVEAHLQRRAALDPTLLLEELKE